MAGNNLANEGTISPNGRWIALRGTSGGDDLWAVGVDGFVMQRLSSGNTAPRMIRWSKNSQTIWFLDGTGALRHVSPTAGGILPIDDHKIERPVADQAGQML